MTIAPITILGFGVAGQLLLSHILDVLPSESVAIIDSDFIGGSLTRDYGAIKSNTTIQQKATSLRSLHPAWAKTASALESYGAPDDCIPLASLAYELHRTAMKLASDCKRIQGTITKAIWDPTVTAWTLTLSTGATHMTKVLCCATGMKPRQIACGCLPTIPLRIALDPDALKRVVHPGDTVLVLGSAHSGTLIMKHCLDISGVTIRVVYRGQTPFRYARDGAYDGIKQESAVIADMVQQRQHSDRLALISTDQIGDVISASRQATWLIGATGFTRDLPEFYSGEGMLNPILDPATGTAPHFPTLMCFGACAPNETEVEGKRYPDISLGSFVDQIQARWPALRQMIQSAQDVAHV